jgi:hypothetical protein
LTEAAQLDRYATSFIAMNFWRIFVVKRIKHPRNFLFPISLFFWTMIFSFKASADTSCNVLLSDLANHLKSPTGQVSLQHLTNYQANGQWWGGYTTVSLRLSRIGRVGNEDLVGSGSRLISSRFINLGGGGFGQSQPFSVRQPDPMSYVISIRKVGIQTGTITFQGKYGPYDMTCLGDKFAIVNTGDSIETFTFSKSFGPR